MTPNDAKIHLRIKQGDVKAFEQVFRDNFKPLTAYANALLRDMDLAQEVVQEFFYTYWKNREHIAINNSLNAYMYQSIKNLALKQIERQRVRTQYANRVGLETPEMGQSPSQGVETAEVQRLISRTLNQMPDRCRQIFLLSRTQGLKYQQIADRLKISVKTVEVNMGKALMMFRNALEQFDKYAY